MEWFLHGICFAAGAVLMSFVMMALIPTKSRDKKMLYILEYNKETFDKIADSLKILSKKK